MDLTALRIGVIGGGIGGLSAALALRRFGAMVVVYERASVFSEVGQGLGVFANAVRALDWLGVGACVRSKGQAMHEASTFAPSGALLLRTDPAEHMAKTGVPSLLMARPDLHQCLMADLPVDALVSGMSLAAIEFLDKELFLAFEDGSKVGVDLVIGADGWNSVVRKILFGAEPPRYSGLACWRGMASGVSLDNPHLLPVIQGAGPQFGIGPLGSDCCYWFAAYPEREAAGPSDPEEARSMLLRMFRGFPFGVEKIIAATQPSAMLRTDLYDRPKLDHWSKGRATLVGDAAHPMVPTLGQGAAMAIEDAVVLARRLPAAGTLEEGLALYEAERRPRTAKIAQMAHTMAWLGLWTNPIAVGARNLCLRLTPTEIMQRTAEQQIGYDATIV